MKYTLDMHCHTIACDHAYSTVSEYAAQAAKLGLSLIAITDHCPKMPGSCTEIHFSNFIAIPKKLYGVEVLSGAELNIIDFEGGVDLPEKYLKRLDVIIASYHRLCINPGTIEENTKGMLSAMENKYISVIGHPGDPNFPVDLELIAKKAAETNTILEINNASLSPDATVRAGSREHIKQLIGYCKKYGVPIVCGSDAHFLTEAGGHGYAYELIEAADYPEHLVLNTSVERFKQAIKCKKA